MIEIKDLEFSYTSKALPALSRISARIEPGVHLLAGENGAGKTTLLRLLAGVVPPNSGRCEINGTPAASDNPDEIGRTFILEEDMFFPAKNIRKFADSHSPFYPRFSQEIFENNLKAFGLSGHEPFKSLSLGNRKKSQLAYVLALGVDLLLLDEPTNALDIQSKTILRSMLASSIGDDQTVIVATHNVGELDTLYDGCIMISRSQLLFAGSRHDVTEKLAFEVRRMNPDNAIYSETQIGRVLCIFPASPDLPTDIDWRLFYSSLHSNARNAILQQLS